MTSATSSFSYTTTYLHDRCEFRTTKLSRMRKRWLSGAGRFQLGEHGEAVRGVGISQDVTGNKQERDHFVPQIERGALHWQSQMRTHGGHQRQSG
jgi:hypothetical protein